MAAYSPLRDDGKPTILVADTDTQAAYATYALEGEGRERVTVICSVEDLRGLSRIDLPPAVKVIIVADSQGADPSVARYYRDELHTTLFLTTGGNNRNLWRMRMATVRTVIRYLIDGKEVHTETLTAYGAADVTRHEDIAEQLKTAAATGSLRIAATREIESRLIEEI